MWASWTLEVRSEGTTTARSQSDLRGSAEAPVSAMTLHPSALAFSAALITLGDFPLVLIAIKTSPSLPSAST